MRPLRLTALLLAASFAVPAAAQNSTAAAAPPATATPPAPPPGTALPPPTVAPAETAAPEENRVVIREAAPPPPEPVTIDPDAAYPNGFADPADPFGNDLSLARRDSGGFDWGLLGLLGLLGLIPLFRRPSTTTRTVYVDRDEPRRVIREEETRE